MHDVIFENQGGLETDDLLRYAEDLGLDLDRFASELDCEVYGDRVRDDFRSGVRSGVNGAPTFFINGVRFDGSWDESGLLAALQAQSRAASWPTNRSSNNLGR